MDVHNTEERKVTLTKDDINNIIDFFKHFEISMDPGLEKVVENYKNDPTSFTFDDQVVLRAMLAKTIYESKHELFNNEIFDEIKTNCKQAFFDYQFDQDIEEALKK